MKTPRTHNTPTSTRRAGREVKAAIWAARHPAPVLTPAALLTSGIGLGWTSTGGIVGGVAGGLCAWYRVHPDTFDHYAAPRIRAVRRRWRAYAGSRWKNALRACDLVTTNRRTGEERFPRVTKVRSYSPTVDSVIVALAPGQSVRHFEGKLPELADTFKVERIAVERVKPGYVGLVIERSEPFTEVIEAPEMAFESDAVDLKDLYVGDDEFGGELRLPVLGGHLFIAGATGAGKNSIPMSLLRGLAPLIRDGLVRLWLCDPKQMEFSQLRDIAYRYAASHEDCLALVDEYVDDMRATQRGFSDTGNRKVTVSRETPLNLLILDEMGALLAYGDGTTARELRKLLSLVGSQGRATGHSMIGLVQEPTKDTVPVRELFTTRICLRVTAAAHVDMVLGENARLRGALADEIPNADETAGIGYVIRQRSRVPLRIRAAYVNDAEITELVAFVRAGWRGESSHLTAVA
jgi:S-DNA-T family DNA segregation ATPase FtsK/SpoIIIE